MLTLTPTAAEAVRGLLASGATEEGGGIRISPAAPTPEGTPLQIALAEEAAATDETVDESGAKVFVAAEAAPFLDDKVLDADVESGRVRFTIADAAAQGGSDSS